VRERGVRHELDAKGGLGSLETVDSLESSSVHSLWKPNNANGQEVFEIPWHQTIITELVISPRSSASPASSVTFMTTVFPLPSLLSISSELRRVVLACGVPACYAFRVWNQISGTSMANAARFSIGTAMKVTGLKQVTCAQPKCTEAFWFFSSCANSSDTCIVKLSASSTAQPLVHTHAISRFPVRPPAAVLACNSLIPLLQQTV
jgi:hypothetical protein